MATTPFSFVPRGPQPDAATTPPPPPPGEFEEQPPSLEYILDLELYLKDQYREDDQQIKTMREVRELKRKVQLEDRLVDLEVRDPTCTDEIQRVSATLSVNRPRLAVKSDLTDSAQENATLRELWTEAMLDAAGSKEPGPPTFQRMVDACVGDGGAWVKLVPTLDTYERRYSLKPDEFLREVEYDSPDEYEDMTDDEIDLLASGAAVKRRPKKVRSRVIDWQAYNRAAEEAKQEAEVPFDFSSVDALTLYPVYQGRRIGEVLEVSERPVNEVFDRYRLKRDKSGNIFRRGAYRRTVVKVNAPTLSDSHGDPPIVAEVMGEPQAEGTVVGRGKVRFLEHWTNKWVSYVVAGNNNYGQRTGQILAQWQHGLKRHPYFFAPGLFFSHWRNRKVGWSISESKRWLVEYRSFLWTVHGNVCARDTFTPVFRRTDPSASRTVGDDKKPKKDEQWKLGVIYELQPGEEMVPFKWPDVARSLREEIQLVSEAIERLETPRISGQIGGGLEGAGFAVNQILSEAKLRFSPIALSIERCLSEVTKFMWHIVRDVIQEDVWVEPDGSEGVGHVKIGPKELKKPMPFVWFLDPEKPSAKMIEARYLHERLQAGTLGLDQAVERMGDNPDEVRIARALDRIRKSPWYEDYLDRYVLSRAVRGDLLKRAKDAEQEAMTGGIAPPGGALPPGEGPLPANGMGGAGVAGGGGPQDMAALAMAPHGAGARPAPPPGTSVPPGGMSGAGPGVVVPEQAAMAGIQRIG